MKKHLFILSVLFSASMSFLLGQENIIPKITKPQTFKLLNSDYIQQSNLKNEKDWWQPDTIIHYGEPYSYNLRKIYSYKNNGYVENILYQTFINSKWENNCKYIYEYNSRNNLISELYQEYNNGWVDDYKYIFTYDSRNNLLTELSTYWNDSYNRWENDDIFTFEYDSDNNIILELYQIWWDIDELVNEFQYLFTYENGDMTTKIRQEWKNNSWRNKTKYTYTYDENNNQTYYVNEIYENNNWTNFICGIYTYDQNKIISYLYKNWDLDLSDWKNAGSVEYKYDGNTVSSTTKFFSSGTWIFTSKEIWVYDSNNDNIITYLVQKWEENDWVNSKRELYEYEGINLRSYLYQAFDEDWINTKKRIFEYDENSNCYIGKVFIWLDEDWISYNDSFNVGYNNNESTYNVTHPSNKVMLSYTRTPKPAGIEEVEQSTSEITIYPNPAKDNINISVENDKIRNIQIYNLTGKLVKQEKSNKININDLPVGMYIIKVETDAGNYIKKVIKD